MSNSVAVQTITPILEESLSADSTSLQSSVVQSPVVKPVPPGPSEPPTLEMLMQMYATQERECWLCDGIARKIAAAKEISEDDSWHFTSCVLSWEYLHRHND